MSLLYILNEWAASKVSIIPRIQLRLLVFCAQKANTIPKMELLNVWIALLGPTETCTAEDHYLIASNVNMENHRKKDLNFVYLAKLENSL